jgi:hypothetical protein
MSTRRKATADVLSQTRKGPPTAGCNRWQQQAQPLHTNPCSKPRSPRSRERVGRKPGPQSRAWLQPNASKGHDAASPRHPCGEARIERKSDDRAARAISLHTPRSVQPPRSMRWCQRRRDSCSDAARECALPSGGGPRSLARLKGRDRSRPSPQATCARNRQPPSGGPQKGENAGLKEARRGTARCGRRVP